MLSYKQYIEKIEDYKYRAKILDHEFRDKILEDFDREFSKYLKPDVLYKDIKVIWSPRLGFNWDGINKKQKIYIINDRYAISFSNPLSTSTTNGNYYVEVYEMLKLSNENWSIKKKDIFMTNSNDDVKEFVSKYIKDLKERHIKKQQDKEKREFKKMINKYNL